MNRVEELIQQLCTNGVEWKKLGEVCEFCRGTVITQKEAIKGNVPVISGGQTPAYFHNKANRPGNTIVVAGSGAYAGFVSFWEIPIFVSDAFTIKPHNELNVKFVFYFLKTIQHKIYATKKGAGIPHVHGSSIQNFEIPIPPLPIQQEIVRILDTFTNLQNELNTNLQTELEARKKQYAYYRDCLLNFEGVKGVEWKKLGEIANFRNGKGHEKIISLNTNDYIIVNSKFISSNSRIRKYSSKQLSPLYIDDILIVMSDLPNGKALAKTYIIDENDKYTLNQRIGAISVKEKDKINSRFISYCLNRNKQFLKHDNGVDQTNLKKDDIISVILPIPSIDIQRRIVSILDQFETLVNDLSIGLPAELEARRKQYEYYRDKLLTFDRV